MHLRVSLNFQAYNSNLPCGWSCGSKSMQKASSSQEVVSDPNDPWCHGLHCIWPHSSYLQENWAFWRWFMKSVRSEVRRSISKGPWEGLALPAFYRGDSENLQSSLFINSPQSTHQDLPSLGLWDLKTRDGIPDQIHPGPRNIPSRRDWSSGSAWGNHSGNSLLHSKCKQLTLVSNSCWCK